MAAPASATHGTSTSPGPVVTRTALTAHQVAPPIPGLLPSAGDKIAPHTHPQTERVTVLSGSLRLGMGDKFDPKHATELTAGSYAALPPGMKHFAWAEGETIIQVNGEGPWVITYVNPDDDPRKKK